jgi:mannosyltransferase
VARYVPADRRPRDVFAVTTQRTDCRLTAVECPDPAGCLAAADPPRIWVLRYQSHPDPLAGIGEPKESLLRARYRLARVWSVRGLTVGLLTRQPR